MELMRHKTPAMTMRYSHMTVKYKQHAIAELPSFKAEMESLQSSLQPDDAKVATFAK